MARCNDSTCTCVVRGGTGVHVTGSGSYQAPYFIEVDQGGQLSVLDTATVDLNLVYPNDPTEPAVLSANVIARLEDLSNVADAQAPNGYVLGWSGSQWNPVPAATAPVGAVASSGCVQGDGSVGSPVRLVVDPTGNLECGTLGVGVADALLARIAALEARFPVNVLRVERDQSLTLTDNAWTRPASWNVGATVQAGNRMSAASGYITVFDAGVYRWEVTCVWAAQSTNYAPPTGVPDRAVGIEVNDALVKYGQRTELWPGVPAGAVRRSYEGTVKVSANAKLRPAFYQNNNANSASSVIPEAFLVNRIA